MTICTWKKYMPIHLYYHSLNRTDGRDNFGDLLGPYVVRKLTNRKIIAVKHPSMRRYKYFIKHYLTIGSILEVANKNSIIWGSGLIRRSDQVQVGKIITLRGPQTKNRLKSQGYLVPEQFGDPAILLPLLYCPKIDKKHEIGLIPHYVDFNSFESELIQPGIKLIDLITKNVENTINEILQCNIVITSSLHALIVAHAYGVPAIWVKYSDKLGGDDIKFYDYLESVNIKYDSPILFSSNSSIEEMRNLIKTNKEKMLPETDRLVSISNELLKNNPFS